MTDQQRWDTIGALGNSLIHTPNLDRLVRRGTSFDNAYSTCPVCIPARYTLRTGREPLTTAIYANDRPRLVSGQPTAMEERCGPYLARVMTQLGYRTFGIGKFHTQPWKEELGFEVHQHTEELYGSPEHRSQDDYAAFIAREHPEYDWIEELHGERTAMYYMPQRSALPAELTVEAWVAARAVEQLDKSDPKPFFGFVSFIAPHPPFAPPVPYNRMYDPDRMPAPVRGPLELDHLDEQIPWMNYAVYAEDIADPLARLLKARYYGEISYADHCIGRILDSVEKRPDADNTLICFFADHGDHLGDHHGWQKESFFEASTRVPFLISWPARLSPGRRRDELVCLTDLFGIATAAGGSPELRDGADVLAMLDGGAHPRAALIGIYGTPGTPRFKIMVRSGPWKYIYLANGGREQLFNIEVDPNELSRRVDQESDVVHRLRQDALAALDHPAGRPALNGNGLRAFPFTARPLHRIRQFDAGKGVQDFPEDPGSVHRPG
jgi:choline-sulfatase